MEDNQALLYRHIHPSFIIEDKVSSQAFTPTRKDNDHLSTYDGDLITPLESFTHYTESLSLKSSGVMGVMPSECTQEKLNIKYDRVPFTEHVSIDFAALSKGEKKKAAKKLSIVAIDRGWIYKK
tara:strand:- start:1139 stop:1510 length:372 start_codon:yes stop_codon:yes gene_type:complete